MRLLEKSNTLNVLNSIKESTKEPVKVMLYDKWKEYPSVEEAKADMLEAMSFCDPGSHEYSRYAFVLQQLMQGETTCYDDINNIPEDLEESAINENVKGIDISRLAKFLEDSCKSLYKDDTAECYRFLLPDPRLAIYVGWSAGYGDEIRDDVVQSKSQPDYAINMGIKIRNDADWAEFDFLNFPYSENGDVWDAALSVDNLETEDWVSDAEYLAGEYEAILKQAETDKDFVIEESIKIQYLDEAENPENREINALIKGLLTGQTKAKKKLEKMGYTVEFDDDAYKQFGKDYFGKYVKITNNETGKQIIGSYGSRWKQHDFMSAKPVEDNSASSDPVKKQQWQNTFHKLAGRTHPNDKMANPDKFDYKGYLDKQTPDLSEPESEFQRFKKDKAYLKDKEYEAKRIDAARERVANVRNKLNGVVKESFDANEPNTMETVRKYVEENPNGGSILINTFSDNWPHDPLTKEDVGKVIHDVRYYPGNGAAIESYEVEEDPEEYEGGFGYKSLGNYEEPEGFDLNFTDEEASAWAKNFLGINESLKEESIIDVKYIGKDDWDRHIVKDPKTGKFYGDINLTTVGKDKDLSRASWHTYSGNDPYDGEPDMPIGDNIKFNIVNPDEIPSDYQRFEYSLLSRLESDCKYFLGNGNGFEGHLWAGSVDKQIAKMKELYNQLEEKPEWITMEDIDNYEKQMKNFKPVEESLKESGTLWSSEVTEDDYDKEDIRANEYQDYLDGLEDKEDAEDFDEWFNNYMYDDSEFQWDLKNEDLKENILPMIDDQVKGAIFIIGDYHSNYPDFRKSGPGGKVVKDADDLVDWLSEEDKVVITYDDNDALSIAGYDHDGSISGDLYTLPDDPHKILEIALSTDMYDKNDYEDNNELVEDFLYDLSIGNIYTRDIKKPELLVPIKNGFRGDYGKK